MIYLEESALFIKVYCTIQLKKIVTNLDYISDLTGRKNILQMIANFLAINILIIFMTLKIIIKR